MGCLIAPPPGLWLPRHNNQLFASYDPIFATSGSVQALSTGVVTIAKLPIPQSKPVSNVSYGVQQAEAGATAGQNGIAVYSRAGVLLGQTAMTLGDTGGPFLSTGSKKTPLAATIDLVGGENEYAWVAFLANVITTGPGFFRSPTSSLANVDLIAADGFRFATADTGRTTFPASLGALTADTAHSFWVGLS